MKRTTKFDFALWGSKAKKASAILYCDFFKICPQLKENHYKKRAAKLLHNYSAKIKSKQIRSQP